MTSVNGSDFSLEPVGLVTTSDTVPVGLGANFAGLTFSSVGESLIINPGAGEEARADERDFTRVSWHRGRVAVFSVGWSNFSLSVRSCPHPFLRACWKLPATYQSPSSDDKKFSVS